MPGVSVMATLLPFYASITKVNIIATNNLVGEANVLPFLINRHYVDPFTYVQIFSETYIFSFKNMLASN